MARHGEGRSHNCEIYTFMVAGSAAVILSPWLLTLKTSSDRSWILPSSASDDSLGAHSVKLNSRSPSQIGHIYFSTGLTRPTYRPCHATIRPSRHRHQSPEQPLAIQPMPNPHWPQRHIYYRTAESQSRTKPSVAESLRLQQVRVHISWSTWAASVGKIPETLEKFDQSSSSWSSRSPSSQLQGQVDPACLLLSGWTLSSTHSMRCVLLLPGGELRKYLFQALCLFQHCPTHSGVAFGLLPDVRGRSKEDKNMST